MAEFAYNDAKNASSSHTVFELKYGYHPTVLVKGDVDLAWNLALLKS